MNNNVNKVNNYENDDNDDNEIKENNDNNIISTFNLVQNESEKLNIIDPMFLLSIIIVVCLIIYVGCYKLKFN